MGRVDFGILRLGSNALREIARMFRISFKFSMGRLTVEKGEDGFSMVAWGGSRWWQLFRADEGWQLDTPRTAALREARGW